MSEFISGLRCPRCGSSLIHQAGKVWCSFVGGEREKPCAYGIDSPRTLVPQPDVAGGVHASGCPICSMPIGEDGCDRHDPTEMVEWMRAGRSGPSPLSATTLDIIDIALGRYDLLIESRCDAAMWSRLISQARREIAALTSASARS
jgi:hypothetical protein